MQNLIYTLPIILLILFFWKADFFKRDLYKEAFSLDNALVVRGFAAISVVLCHTGIPVFYRHGYLFVAIFYFFSGYGLMYGFLKKKDYLKGFLKKRFLSLMIPYWVATLLYIAWFFILGHTFEFKEILLSFIFPYLKGGRIVTVAWYVCTIAVFYLAFYIFFKFFSVKKAICLISVFNIAYIIYCKEIVHVSSIVWYCSNLPFLLGILIAYKKEFVGKIIKDKYFILAITFVTTLSIALLYVKVSRTIMQQIASLSIVSLLVLVMYRTHLKSKVLAFCGKISYEIYLCHYLIMLPLNNTYKFVNPGYKSSIYSVQLDNQFLVAVFSVLGTICISYFIKKFNSKVMKLCHI